MFPVDSFQATLAKVVAIFEQHKIRFHLTGGITTIAYGEPRMTQDIDLVIDNEAASAVVGDFVESCVDSDFMCDPQAIRQAIQSRSMFQLFDRVEALKLDIYPREMIKGELDRSQLMEVFEGVALPVASRPDAAASKLVWISKGSHKSRRDLRQIVRNASTSDKEQIDRLAENLKLGSLLEEVLSESDEILD